MPRHKADKDESKWKCSDKTWRDEKVNGKKRAAETQRTQGSGEERNKVRNGGKKERENGGKNG